MAYVTMVRVTDYPGRDNLIAANAPNFQFYEASLTATGTTDWILIPNDGIPVNVTMSFGGTATASVEGTNSPSSLIDGRASGTPVAVAAIASGSATASADVKGYTAIRLNVSAYTDGGVKISVRL